MSALAIAPRPAAPGLVRLRLLLQLLREWSWPELRHHPWRSLAAVVAVMLGVALAFSVQLINQSALGEFSAAVRAVNGQPDFELRGPLGGFDEALYERVARHPQVAVASPLLEFDTLALDAQGLHVAIKVVGLDALVAASVSPDLLPRPQAGSARLAMLDPQAIFLNEAARRRLPDATVTLVTSTGTRALSVQGRVSAGGAPLAVLDIAGAQAAFGWQGRLSRIDVRLRPGADRAAVLRELALPPGLRAASPDEAAQRVSNVSRAYRVNLSVLALVALFTGAFLVFSVLALAVAQRQPQLALLGVLGLGARDRLALVLAEAGLLGLLGSALGLALGTALAATALRLLAGDLGGGYFPGVAPRLQFDGLAALVYGALGVVAALVGGWLPARSAQALAPAQALKGLGGGASAGSAWAGPALLAIGVALSLLPPVGGLPLPAYVGVALLLLGGIACVPAGVGLLLRAVAPPRRPLALLAVERARQQRHTATLAVAGVVASLSLAVALTIMVASFREAITQWLDTVLPADLYARAAPSASAGEVISLPLDLPRRAEQLPGVAKAQAHRVRALPLDPTRPAVTLIARRLEDPATDLPLVGSLLPLPAGATAVYVSEAMVSLYGATPGSWLRLPLGQARTPAAESPSALAFGPASAIAASAASAAAAPSASSARSVTSSASATSPTSAAAAGTPGDGTDPAGARLFVRGVWRDYARQFGAVMMAAADYERLSGDTKLNDLALWLRPGADAAAVQQDLRALSGRLGLEGSLLEFASSGEIRAISLRIFDRSFAVTYWLQAVAIAIGLFGIAASFSAQVLARRKEFGLLAHLGLTRRQVLSVVAAEGAVWTSVGALLGLLLGIAVSVVLVKVVNPQSFHWTMALHLPGPRLALLCAAVVVAGTLTAWLAARHAASRSMALAVKEDW